MNQQPGNSAEQVPAHLPGQDQLGWLHAESVGREKLRLLLEQWLARNGWSLAVVSRLAELSLLSEADLPIPDWSAGMPLQHGALVNHRGHAWEAIGTPLSEPADGATGWIDHGLTSRLHASGLNLFLRNRKSGISAAFLLEMGRLNEWVARVKTGQAKPPADQRLSELVMAATVIRDGDGPLGPEELLSIAGGRLNPPPWPAKDTAASDGRGGVPARQLRAAAAAAGLDIIDDWAVIADLYPSDDRGRLGRLQQALQGLVQWDAQEEENERAACVILLQRLHQHAQQTAGNVRAEHQHISQAHQVMSAMERHVKGSGD